MGVLSTIFTVASGALSVISAIQQSNAQQAEANYERQIANRNRIVADQNRQLALRTAEIDANDKRRENARTYASVRAAYGASGIEMAGSPLDVLEDTALESELDVRRTEYEGRVRGREGALEMLGYSEKAQQAKMKGQNAKTAGVLNIAGAVINTGAKLSANATKAAGAYS